MIELTVKTLDSRNHSFSVPDDFTVRQLKERIAESISISAESQRLIYCGRVLQDEKPLREYDVNGKVIHLVQRAPPVSNGSGPDRGPGNTRSAAGSNTRRTPLRLFGHPGNTGNAMYLGAMAFPAEIMDASGMSMQQPRECLSQSRLNVVRNMLRRASVILDRLENPPQASSDTSPENGNGSPERSAEEEASASAPAVEIASVEITPTSFVIENPQDLGEPAVVVQIESSTEQSNTSDRESQPGSEQQTEQNGGEETGDGSRASSRYPRTQALADLLDQAAEVNHRVQPFMAQYQQLMRDDPVFTDQTAVATNQRLFTSVSEIMHNLAHAYHALSDIMCYFSQPPPRFLRCRPVLIHHSAVVQTGIPIQVATNLNQSTNQQPNASSTNSQARENVQSTASSTSTGPAQREESPPEPAQAQPAPAPTSASVQPTAAPPQSGVTSTAEQTPAAGQTPTVGQTPAAGQIPPTGLASSHGRLFRTETIRLSRGGFGISDNSNSNSAPTTRTPQIRSVSPGFEIFVDVTPGSITIDSVNVPNSTTEANTWQNPPDFVQNLVSALAGQFMGATLQQYRFPEQQNAGTTTSTTAASTTSTTAASTTSTAATTQQGGAAASSAQNSQARGNTATHPTTATQTRSTPRPHVHLSPSIHGLRANSFDPFLPCNSHHIRSGRGRFRPTQTNTSNVPPPAAATEPRVTRIIATPSANGNISVRPDPASVTREVPRAARNEPIFPPLFPAAELQFFFNAFRGANSAMTRPQNPPTLSDLLESVPGYTYTPGESIFTDIFMVLAQSLTFVDMMEMRMGSSDGLVRARPQLQQLITQRLLNNRPLSISAITQIIDRVNSELQPHFTIFENARWREEVDLTASINLYNHSMLPSIINTIMEEDQATFQATLINKCVQYARQLCTLLQYCCVDGNAGMEAIVRAFVNQMTTDLPRILQDWTITQSMINFRTFLTTMNIPIEDIERFLVYHNRTSATSPQPAATPPAIPPAAEPMDVQEMEETRSEPISSLIREPPVADVPPTQHINEAIGWQSALPSEWVPIITRDSQRQRRQNPQGPFSDAYLSGMPSKRRKLITSAKPQGNLSQVITESMAVALGAAGMSSGPEVDVVAQRAGQDCSLRTAYREQVRVTLGQNLESHPDYVPDKYPNTSKYLNKK